MYQSLRHTVFISLAGAWLLVGCRPAPDSAAPSTQQAASTQQAPPPESADDRYRRLVIGTWTDDYQGGRVHTIRDDGSATMVVKLTGVTAMLVAKQMTFEEQWTIQDGVLTTKALGGTPELAVKTILQSMGDVSSQTILELSDERLLLVDEDDQQFDWKRQRPAAPESSEAVD